MINVPTGSDHIPYCNSTNISNAKGKMYEKKNDKNDE